MSVVNNNVVNFSSSRDRRFSKPYAKALTAQKLNIDSSLTVSYLNFNSSNVLSNYSTKEVTLTMQHSAGTSTTVTVSCVRVGNMVTVSWKDCSLAIPASPTASVVESTTGIPAAFRPDSTKYGFLRWQKTGPAFAASFVTLDRNGILGFYNEISDTTAYENKTYTWYSGFISFSIDETV